MPKTHRKIGNDRFNHSYKTKDKGSSAKDIMNYRLIDAEEHPFFKPKESRNKINIIPFEIKSENHPLVRSKEMEVGDLDYCFDIWVHRRIGPTGVDCVCLKRNYNKPCPICAEADKMKEAGKKKEYDELKATRRAYYNVIDLTDEEQKIQIFSVSHYLFEKELIEVARDDEDGNGIVPFSEIDEGKVVEFRMVKESINGHDMPKFKNFTFRDRDEDLDESLIDDAVSFDEIMILRDAEELENIMFEGEEGEDEDTPPSKSHSRKPKGEVEDSESEPEEIPNPHKKTSSKKAIPEDTEDTEEDTCPHGFEFGKQFDEEKSCVRCKKAGECEEEYERLASMKAKKKTK